MDPRDLLLLLALRWAHVTSRTLLASQLEAGPAALAPLAHGHLTPEHLRAATRQCRAIAALGICVLPPWRQPPWLSMVSPRVPALFVRGDPDLLRQPAVGIVGSRRACPEACAWAERQAQQRARAGFVVISGGARGVDSAAHRGALAAGAPTVFYLGTPVDRVYPQGHRALVARALAQGGAVVSEHGPSEPVQAWAHAARNRFIAAHAQALLVAEAALGSGTLGTAKYAHRYGVPVWVSPPGVARDREGLEELVQAGIAQVLTEEAP